MPADIQCSISKPRYIRTETTEIAPTITIHTHPQDYNATSTTAEFTCVASLSDFIEPKLIWEKAESQHPTVFTSIGTATVTFDNETGRFTSTKSLTGLSNSNDDGDKYRVKVQAWDGSFVNSNIATLSVDPPTLSFTRHPSHPSLTSLGAAPICDDGTASFSVVAASNQPGTTNANTPHMNKEPNKMIRPHKHMMIALFSG